MRYLTLFVALALCAAASTVLAVDAPAAVSLLSVGAFMIFTPGLLLTHALALPDRLLALVVGLLTGPTLWVLVATFQLFAGLWAPRTTVLWAAGGLGLVTLVLAARGLRREVESDDEAPVRAPRVEQYAVDDGE
ncbi:hypothetical protein GCM10011519_03850 [Marmoricola endophyticus]|uniref:SPW repeat-containing protein n=1 Tax=Marmoricola endophyticus TaxID=2040280 RepID=A0A917BB25_9ACTN|nr:hypothetical protein [Marmoricola endophyticus]GGF33655.1 hypothetical protein GCM10011519_03850 [Marmoricola endophyticus]